VCWQVLDASSHLSAPLTPSFTNLGLQFFWDVTLILDAENRVICLFNYIFIIFLFINLISFDSKLFLKLPFEIIFD